MTISEITSRAATIELIVTDVDGTLTDGGVYYGPDGEVMKRFHIRDGMAIELLQPLGVHVAIMTGEMSPSIRKRAEKLAITRVFLGCKDKVGQIKELSESEGIPLDRIAFIGDDINDREVMELVGLSACPRDAVRKIIDIAGYVCNHRGGNGAFREFAELIIDAKEQKRDAESHMGFR